MHLETIPPLRTVYIRHTGPYGPGNAQTMERLKAWAKSRGLLGEEAVILGIAQDNPRTTPPDACRYDACLVLDSVDPQDEEIRLGTAGGGNYAVYDIEHTAQAIRQAWNDIFAEPTKQGLVPDESRPVIERYAAKMVARHRCELCVPVR